MRVVGSLATQFAPPFSLILHFFTAAAIVQLVFPIFIFLNGEIFKEDIYSLQFASFWHFYLVGFIMMVVFGALYQLIPVALEIPVFSFKLGYIHFYLFISGISIFIFSLLKAEITFLIPIGSIFLFSSFIVYFINFFLSIKNLEKLDITVTYLLTANIFLLIGICIGLLLGLNFYYGFLSLNLEYFIYAHVIFVVFGFIIFLVAGIEMILLPMFSVSHKFSAKFIKVSYIFLSVSIFGLVFSKFLDLFYLFLLSFLLFLSGIISLLLQVLEIYRHKPKKRSDFALNGMFLSHVFLPVGIAMFFVDKSTGLFITSSLFFGVLIYSSLYKILPFLTWFHKFSNIVGIKPVPTLSEMLPENFPRLQLILHVIGSILFSLFFTFKFLLFYYTGLVMLFISGVIFLYNFIYVITYQLKEGG